MQTKAAPPCAFRSLQELFLQPYPAVETGSCKAVKISAAAACRSDKALISSSCGLEHHHLIQRRCIWPPKLRDLPVGMKVMQKERGRDKDGERQHKRPRHLLRSSGLSTATENDREEYQPERNNRDFPAKFCLVCSWINFPSSLVLSSPVIVRLIPPVSTHLHLPCVFKSRVFP
ncbi:uncharacterized protein AB9W97_003340 isoform 1-T1 [Spinachia spinachia]